MVVSTYSASDSLSGHPYVSILINNYNYGSFLDACILSALAQKYDSFEIIVVDDGSEDDSREILKKYTDRIKTVFKENAGQASAFNKGFELSKGEIICFLDADDTFYSYKLAEVVKTFAKNPQTGWLFHELDYVDKEGEQITQDCSQALSRSVFIDARASMKRGNAPAESIPCGLCFKREVLAQILPMPESSGVSISDNYLKYAAIGISPGLLLNQRLAVQRIHGENTYTFRQNNQRLRAEIHVKTGYYLQECFPAIGLFADKLFVKGLAEMLVTCNFKGLFQSQEVRRHLLRNIRFDFLLLNSLKCLYHCFRLFFLKLGNPFVNSF
ncbi:MAG: glycosyltransferase [Cyanobacteria bacterium P01_D01_bin.56]